MSALRRRYIPPNQQGFRPHFQPHHRLLFWINLAAANNNSTGHTNLRQRDTTVHLRPYRFARLVIVVKRFALPVIALLPICWILRTFSSIFVIVIAFIAFSIISQHQRQTAPLKPWLFPYRITCTLIVVKWFTIVPRANLNRSEKMSRSAVMRLESSDSPPSCLDLLLSRLEVRLFSKIQ